MGTANAEGSMITSLRQATCLRRCRIMLAVSACLLALPAAAEDPILVRVNAFPNAKALPLHAGMATGIFAKHGLTIDLQFTESSRSQRDGLAAGTFDIAQAAIDNAVAMVGVGKHDVVIVSGGDSGMNEFIVQPEMTGFADLRGRVSGVDSPDTAYALQAKKILAQHGLQEGSDYTVKAVGAAIHRLKAMTEDKANAGAIVNLPFTVQAEQMGLKSLGRIIDLLGPYQAAGAFTLRPWARDNGPILERYLAGYVESLRWVRDPANRSEVIALLVDHLKLAPGIAGRTYELLLDPSFGFTPDAAFDMQGFRNMLALRAEFERRPTATPTAPEAYLDLGYYERALARLKP